MTEQLLSSRMAMAKTLRIPIILALIGLVIIPSLYAMGYLSIETVSRLGRYVTYAILAVGLDLLWGYVGILGLCQATFFCLGTYAMGMYLAHHGEPAGTVDGYGWKIPSCLFVVYDSDVGQTEADWTVPFFWKPFWSLPATIVLGLVIPAVAAFAIGYFVFRSRVRGVYFAILTQAIAVAAWMVFSKNEMMLGGTNGLTAFDHFTFGNHERIEVVVVSEEDLKAMEEGLEELQKKQAQIRQHEVEYRLLVHQVGATSSETQASKMLEQELAVHFLQLTEAVGHLPTTVEAALQKVDKKINACVEAFQLDEKPTLIETALDELKLALDAASKEVASLEEDSNKIEKALEELRNKQAQVVSESMSDANATKMLEQELAGDFGQLTNAVEDLPPEVGESLLKVIGKLNRSVEAFKREEKATLVSNALDELGFALEQASTATKHALVVRPDRLKEVQLALERHRKEKRVTVTKEVDGKLYVHRNFKLTDGNETSPKSEGMELQIPFGGQDPDRSYALTLEQSGVDEEWEVALNDQNIGNLKRGPPQDIRLSVPSGVLKASENNLIIRPVTPHVQDEIEIGRIRLAGDVPPLGGTLEQKGDNFLSVPEFGVNLNIDYNVLVIHADPANADKSVELQDWAKVNYLGPRVKGDSVKLVLYVLSVLALFGAYFLCRWIVRSRLGRVLVAIRDDESTLRFFGYRPYVYKLFAFCVAAVLAGLGGMLYVPQMTITTPRDMEASMSILIVVWVAVGGRGTLSGAILGTLTFNLLYTLFTSEHDFLLFTWKPDYWQFILGGLFVSVVLFFPRGLMSLPEKFGLSQKIANLWAKLIHGRQS